MEEKWISSTAEWSFVYGFITADDCIIPDDAGGICVCKNGCVRCSGFKENILAGG